MRRVLCASAVMMLVGAGCTSTESGSVAVAPAQDDDAGFITLFDGTSTQGWAVYHEEPGGLKDPEAFQVIDGILTMKGQCGYWYRYEAREFANFIFRCEFNMEKGANSGICFHTTREGSPPYTGWEVQILDEYGHNPHRTSCGAIYDVVTPMYNAARPPGEWNQLEVYYKDRKVQVTLNGLKVIDTDFSLLTKPIGKFSTPYAQLPTSGLIAIQDHCKPIVRFRNISIKPLD
jgi:hypothetical protein